MPSRWKVLWTKEVQKYYKKYPQKKRIQRVVERLCINPYDDVNIKKLVGQLDGLYRYRLSNLRLIYKVDEIKNEIILVYLGTRGDVY